MIDDATALKGTLIAVSLLAAVVGYEANDIHAMIQREHEIDRLIKSELPIASTNSQIENFFKKYHFAFSYDKYANRYVSLIPHFSLGANEGTLIQLYLDDHQRLERVDVQNEMTAL
jgi:hypothetical protein